ncbi:MAG: type I-E CRISPR-associated endoribonuclease Cas2e [Methylocystis sp.]|jgi:CRISPR-associated protein Cas2
MPTTIIVTRDVADRYRGFLASVMPEVAPGVYVSPELSKGVRDRVWSVLTDWWRTLPGGSVVMAWKDNATISGLGLETLGLPAVDLVELDGVMVVKRRPPKTKDRSIST